MIENNKFYISFIALLLTSMVSAQKQYKFTTNKHYILNNGKQLDIRGVVYTPIYPGYSPWDISEKKRLPSKYRSSILKDLNNIKAMGANTLRIWDAPKYTYKAIEEVGDLFFLQTIWINTEQRDYQDYYFKKDTKANIRTIIDRIYSVYKDNNPPLIAYIVGNELTIENTERTNKDHPRVRGYICKYIKAPNVSPAQAFIAEMADYVKTYEFETYGNVSLVTYANEISTPDLLDTPFLDFRSQNVYSWARCDLEYLSHIPLHKKGSSTGTIFQGWVEELKSKYPDMPLLISETGLSISPSTSYDCSRSLYGYGGNTSEVQKEGILQNLKDIKTAKSPLAGVVIHEYLDSWWKSVSSSTQNPEETQEWFGLVKFKKIDDWYETEYREVYFKVKENWVNR